MTMPKYIKMKRVIQHLDAHVFYLKNHKNKIFHRRMKLSKYNEL